jgi:hypothetical protein
MQRYLSVVSCRVKAQCARSVLRIAASSHVIPNHFTGANLDLMHSNETAEGPDGHNNTIECRMGLSDARSLRPKLLSPSKTTAGRSLVKSA